jgi:hypothetical protein
MHFYSILIVIIPARKRAAGWGLSSRIAVMPEITR